MANNTYNVPRQNSYEATLTQVLAGDASSLTIYVDTVPVCTIPSGVYLGMTINPTKGFTQQEVVLIESIDSVNNTLTVKSGGRAQDRYNGDSPSALEHVVGSKIVLSNPYSLWEQIEAAIENKSSTNQDSTFSAAVDFTADDAAATFRIPNMTEAIRDTISTPANGMLIYNTTSGEFEYYDGGAWQSVGTASVPNASETVAGIIELSTAAERAAGTSTGGTGATLVPTNDALVKTSSGAGDENKIPVLGSSGKFASGFIPAGPAGALENEFTTGAAIDGSTTPQIVAISDGSNSQDAGEVFEADANDLTNFFTRPAGFINTNAADNTPTNVIQQGPVSGFTGLTQGVNYLLSGTAGEISKTAQVNPAIVVGYAQSDTEFFATPPRYFVHSQTSTALNLVQNATQDLQISIGFRPISLIAIGGVSGAPDVSISTGSWVNGTSGYNIASFETNTSTRSVGAQSSLLLALFEDLSAGDSVRITVQSFDDNSITIRFQAIGGTINMTVILALNIHG